MDQTRSKLLDLWVVFATDQNIDNRGYLYLWLRLSFVTFISIWKENQMNIIWTAVVVLFILWVLGFSINIGGSLIHLLLVLVLIGIVYNLFIGRRIG
jgi:hypothetical protein